MEDEHPIIKKKLEWAHKNIQKVKPNVPNSNMLHPVTDLNYYMDGFLRDNLNEIPRFLKKAWDCVIIVSGNGKVRIGKSTEAIQDAYYVAWIINEQKKKSGEVPKDNPVPFNIDNVAFDPDELMKIAGKLPRNSVIVYDEGRAGLDSARAMENINKAMQDFFQECGQYGHVIFIVLPDYFKLQETIAVPRSLFLINVYADKDYNRGYFEFFNEPKKELLYIIGKKRWGTTAKYLAVNSNFRGRFTSYFPIDQESYNQKKRDALKKRRKSRLEIRWHYQRDVLLYILKTRCDYTIEDISKVLQAFPDCQMATRMVENSLTKVRKRLEAEGVSDLDEEKE
jgi:hypothetical protein